MISARVLKSGQYTNELPWADICENYVTDVTHL